MGNIFTRGTNLNKPNLNKVYLDLRELTQNEILLNAVKNKDRETCNRIVGMDNPDVINKVGNEGDNPLHLAIKIGNISISTSLISSQDIDFTICDSDSHNHLQIVNNLLREDDSRTDTAAVVSIGKLIIKKCEIYLKQEKNNLVPDNFVELRGRFNELKLSVNKGLDSRSSEVSSIRSKPQSSIRIIGHSQLAQNSRSIDEDNFSRF